MKIDNIALITSRLTKGENYGHCLATQLISEVICLSPESSNNGFVFPLANGSTENLSTEFRDFLNARYSHHYTPEEILGYIYAILHAPTYRRRYAEFLRIDFPRIPFADEPGDFEALSALGWALVQAHLLRELPRAKLGELNGRGDNMVSHVCWLQEDASISINATQSFRPVPEAVWNFHIGGYQVLDKYLKSRKSRTHFSPKSKGAGAPYPLTLDEITHVGRICDALAFTIAQMAAIDDAYLQAFPDGG